MFFKNTALLGFSENHFTNYYADFASYYGELAKNHHPLSALSILSQNREEIVQNRQRIAQVITTLVDLYFKEEFKESSLNLLTYYYRTAHKIDWKFNYNRKSLLDAASYLSPQSKPKNKFRKSLSPYLEEDYRNEFYTDKFYSYLKKYFKEKRRLESLEAVISQVIENDYPKEISKEPTTDQKEERNLGRPLDDVAPQHLIAEKVNQLVKKKDFQHKNGKPKPTKIRDYLMDDFPELVGELSERAVFDRVKKALKTNDMQ